MLTSAGTAIDPLLLTSQVQRHDDHTATAQQHQQEPCIVVDLQHLQQQQHHSSTLLAPPLRLDSLEYSTCSSFENATYSSSIDNDDEQQQQFQQRRSHQQTQEDRKQPQKLPQRERINEDIIVVEKEELESPTPFEQLMNKGNHFRQLRALALADEMERNATTSSYDDDNNNNEEKKSDVDNSNINYCKNNNSHSGSIIVDDDREELQDDVYTITTTNTSSSSSSNNLNGYNARPNNFSSNNSHTKNTVKILNYNSYLAHQRYYDDLKHIDITYIDYNVITGSHETEEEKSSRRVVIEQRKRLGKGGLCWDAAFILGEHIICHEREWNNNSNYNTNVVHCSNNNNTEGEEATTRRSRRTTTVLELGAGTGLCGIMVAKATCCHVTITDLPELEELMDDNVRRNFGPPHHLHHHHMSTVAGADANSSTGGAADISRTEEEKDVTLLSTEERKLLTYLDGAKAKGTVTSRVLRWGVEQDYFVDNCNEEEEDYYYHQQHHHQQQQAYDVIIGADIVASLYDPVSLAHTLHALCGPTTKIYISSKSRLDEPHQIFDAEMSRLFDKVVKNFRPCSRLKNPNVFIIQAEGKKNL